jgi:hypothetical protein
VTRAEISLVTLSVAFRPSAWLQLWTGVLGDVEFSLVFPFGLAGLVTVALFCVEWVLERVGRNGRSLEQQKSFSEEQNLDVENVSSAKP